MINRLYGMLAPEALSTEYYYRRSTQAEEYVRELDILIPRSTEDAYRQFCADQLCTLVYESSLKDILLELDPNNTYEYPAEAVDEKDTEITGVPGGVVLNLADASIQNPWVRKVVTLSYDGVDTVTYEDGKTVEWGATGTPPIVIDGVVMSFSGAPPVSSFIAVVSMVRKPYRSIMTLYNQLESESGITWTTQLAEYNDITVPSTKLAAYVLNTLAKL